jgi:hypothetical protein
MQCSQVERLLDAYADEELDKSERVLLDAHLAECAACQMQLESILKLSRHVQVSAQMPEALRSKIADRLQQASTKRTSRFRSKEVLQMKARWGLAALVAAGLIVVGVFSTSGSAQAALSKMRKAVTGVHSSHLRVEIDGPIDLGHDGGRSADAPQSKDNGFDVSGMLAGAGKSIDVWSEGDKWKADIFGGLQAFYRDGDVTVMMDGKTFAHVKADKGDVPKDMGNFLFRELSKATEEIRQHCTVRQIGRLDDNGRSLRQLEVTGIQDKGKDFRMLYYVDESTDLPARFEVYANDEHGQQQLMATITCEFNQDYPDSMFLPGSD